MKKGHYLYIGSGILFFLLIIFLAAGLWKPIFYPKTDDNVRTKVIIPRETNLYSVDQSAQTIWEENLDTKIPMEDGEAVIAVLNRESEEHFAEEQYVVYRNSARAASPVFLTFLSYDEKTKGYKRMWNIPCAATNHDTITLSSHDIIGDRSNCIIITGMNARNEHTMTIFRRTPGEPVSVPFNKIAELQIEGSIIIQEVTRSLAYQQGLTRGQSYNIAAYGHDNSSTNMLDQIETIYSFNLRSEQYEQTNVSRIPGSQIEQRRLRELLSGAPGVFENFINDLWYYVGPQGSIDSGRYLYFDHAKKEIIFFGDDSQQVFLWQSSNYTRFGMFIRSQNISISTLLRSIDIELESLDSIRLRVIEDVRLRITANTTWDGSYRRAGAGKIKEVIPQMRPTINAVYDSSWGRINFNDSGEYTITSSGNTRKGRYVFYKVDNNDLLELRPEMNSRDEADKSRMVYKTESGAGILILSRVRVGTSGIQDLLEPPVTLTPVN